MSRTNIAVFAERLALARREGPIARLTVEDPALTLDDAYAIQRQGVRLRCASGESIVGVKLGLTSKEKAEQMGVKEVILGVLTDSMEVADGAEIDVSRNVHPRIEPEVAFRLASDIDPVNPPADLRTVVDAIAPALEVIDSRFDGFSFSLVDVVADNTSASAYAIGPWTEISNNNMPVLTNRAVELSIDDELVETGTTSAILGDPWRALPDAVRLAARYGQTLSAGDVLLAGAATAAVAIEPGQSVEAFVEGLGSVSLVVTGESAQGSALVGNGLTRVVEGQAVPRGRFPHVKIAGDLIFISGTSSRCADNSIVGASVDALGVTDLDIRTQTLAVLANIETLLGEVGCSLNDLVQCTTYLVNMNDFGGYNEVWAETFTAEGPTRTTVAVHQLPHPHLLIEIQAVAVRPRI